MGLMVSIDESITCMKHTEGSMIDHCAERGMSDADFKHWPLQRPTRSGPNSLVHFPFSVPVTPFLQFFTIKTAAQSSSCLS